MTVVPRCSPNGAPKPQVPLVDILADMVRSALAWEAEHGEPPQPDGDRTANALTGILQAYTLPPHEISAGGGNHDHDDNSEERAQADNL